ASTRIARKPSRGRAAGRLPGQAASRACHALGTSRAISASARELLLERFPVVLVPAGADGAVAAIRHARLPERDPRSAIRPRERERRARMHALWPVALAPGLHDALVLRERDLLAGEAGAVRAPGLTGTPTDLRAIAEELAVAFGIEQRFVHVVRGRTADRRGLADGPHRPFPPKRAGVSSVRVRGAQGGRE